MITLAVEIALALALASPGAHSSLGGGPILVQRGTRVLIEIDAIQGRALPRPDQNARTAGIVLLPAEPSPTGGARVWVVAQDQGEYALRGFLVDEGGRPLEPAQDPIIRVVSKLPATGASSLELFTEGAPSPLAARSWYRPAALVVLAGWALVPLVVLAARAFRRPAHSPAPPPPAPTPTPAQRLASLLEQADERELSPGDLARLELLCVQALRLRHPAVVAPAGDEPAAALTLLRAHPEAGTLVHALEAWLHSRPGADRNHLASLALRELRRQGIAHQAPADPAHRTGGTP
jgi:hypothetical protein